MKAKGRGETRRFSALLFPELYERLRKAAFDERRPATELVRDAIIAYLDRRDRQPRMKGGK